MILEDNPYRKIRITIASILIGAIFFFDIIKVVKKLTLFRIQGSFLGRKILILIYPI
jgi:hypothetical protein